MLRYSKRSGYFLGDLGQVMPEFADDYEPRKRALDLATAWRLIDRLPAERGCHVAFILGTGARWSESTRAKADDIGPAFVQIHGTKTKAATRRVPVTRLTRALLSCVIEHMPHNGFARWTNVRRDLADACKAIGVEAVTPNDLRRTFGTWLRQGGVPPDLIGVAMGHTDSRMVERVYGRITAEDLGRLLTERLQSASPEPEPSSPPVEARRALSRRAWTIRSMSGEPHDSAPKLPLLTTGEAPVTQEKGWPGPESNRGHGDFQPSIPAQRSPTNIDENAPAVRLMVKAPGSSGFPLAEATGVLRGLLAARAVRR